MKKILINILLVIIVFSLTRCFEETPEYVTVIPYEEIENKLEALRDLEKELRDVGVNVVDYQDQVQDLITEINNLIPPNNVPITYSIGVISAMREDEQIGISGATVSIDIEGTRMTVTTDSDGQAVFEDLRSGVVTVHISVDGYTDVNFVADLLVGTDPDYRATTEDFNVTSAIALYPNTSANGAVNIEGELFYDPDRTDNLADTATSNPAYGIVNFYTNEGTAAVQPFRPAPRQNYTGATLTSTTYPDLDARIQTWEAMDVAVNLFAFIRPNSADYSYIPSGTPGNILIAMYEELFVTVTSNASDGTFQLVLPAGTNGNSYQIHLEEFIGDESYIRAIIDGGTNVNVRDRSVIFTALYGKFGIGPTTFSPGSINSFDLSKVNNFNGTIWATGANTTLSADFYFGSKTKDE